ncbi:hypothetical protein [Methanogenium cariaci]|uniref:hypothetical protein n=1 Tax=Methanogenium cariaci TaxID=2197 RepID=UPI001FE0888E|nr:hypothetical protein [Methanogenium cariaci]
MNSGRKRRDWFVIGVSSVLVLLIVVLFRALLDPLIIAGALATVLIPYHNVLKMHLRAPFSSIIITTGVLIFLVVMLMVSLAVIFANGGAYIQEVFNSIFGWLSIEGGGFLAWLSIRLSLTCRGLSTASSLPCRVLSGKYLVQPPIIQSFS